MQTADTDLSSEKSFESEALTQRDDTQQSFKIFFFPTLPKTFERRILRLPSVPKRQSLIFLKKTLLFSTPKPPAFLLRRVV